MQTTKSAFIKVKCAQCKNEQHIYSHASTPIECLVCNTLLAEPQGGKTKIHAQILESHA